MPLTAGPAHPLHLTERRGGGYRRIVGDVHVTLRGSVIAMLVFAGWVTDGTPARAHLWITGGLIALVLHELAHASAARRAGVTPYVELSWRGGLTRWFPPDALTRATEARVLLAGPLAGLAVALAAERSLTVITALPLAQTQLSDLVAIIGGVSLVVAAVDLLPIFPRDGSRLLLLCLRGGEVERTVRAAAFGAVTAALATAGLVVGPAPELAAVPGVLLLTNTWLALRGDRAIGQRMHVATKRRDWTSVRRRIVAGCDSPYLAAAAQAHALRLGDHAAAADIGDAALHRGWLTAGFATRTAIARAFLEQDERAMAMVHIAVALGADPAELAREPMLHLLKTRLDWPSVGGPDRSDDFVVDLTDDTPGPLPAPAPTTA